MQLTQKEIETLRSKAEASDVEAQYEMGWRKAIGMGLALDEKGAVEWLRKAADQGHQLAQNNLGARYASGDGVKKDLVKAYVWFHRASLQGDRKAGKNRDSIKRQMSSEEFEKANFILKS